MERRLYELAIAIAGSFNWDPPVIKGTGENLLSRWLFHCNRTIKYRRMCCIINERVVKELILFSCRKKFILYKQNIPNNENNIQALPLSLGID